MRQIERVDGRKVGWRVLEIASVSPMEGRGYR